jgi:hypothetical protein
MITAVMPIAMIPMKEKFRAMLLKFSGVKKDLFSIGCSGQR